jgi:integrase
MHFHAALEEALKNPDLDGSRGEYREYHEPGKNKGHISARNDAEAIGEFLSEFTRSNATFRSYSKELLRLHMWAVLKVGKPISSLTRDDYQNYIEFLKSPPASWCGKRARLGSKEWRPFVGGLQENAIILAFSAIDSMLSWWVNAGYLTGNPLALISQRRKAAKTLREVKVTRFLDDVMWEAFMDEIESLPEKTDAQRYDKERALFLATMLVMLGPRAFEISRASMSDFKNDGYGWFWHTVGKGAIAGKVAMPDDMVAGLRRWREFLGLSPYPLPNEKIPAIPPRGPKGTHGRFDAGSSISPRRINQILKELLFEASKRIEEEYPDKADKMRRASAHWGRHTAITQKVNAGMDRNLVQLDARHANQRTTQGYIHEEDIRRSREASKHRLRRKTPAEQSEMDL